MAPQSPSPAPAPSCVDLYWLPLGAGEASPLVRWSGRAYEALVAARARRPRQPLFHSALEVRLDGVRSVIEVGPVWRSTDADRGVVCEGPVGLPLLGRSRLFRYEVRCWREGSIPDVSEAVASPQRLSTDRERARRVLSLTAACPVVAWGLDELGAGEMWNSNSVVSWLLARSGHDLSSVRVPDHGRAPGWSAGLVVAARDPGPAQSLSRR